MSEEAEGVEEIKRQLRATLAGPDAAYCAAHRFSVLPMLADYLRFDGAQLDDETIARVADAMSRGTAAACLLVDLVEAVIAGAGMAERRRASLKYAVLLAVDAICRGNEAGEADVFRRGGIGG